MLNKLLNSTQVIKPGSIVKSKTNGDKIFIRTSILYPDDSIVYTGYSIDSEGERKELSVIYPQEITSIKEVLNIEKVESKDINSEHNNRLLNMIVNMDNGILKFYYETTRGYVYTDGNQDGKYTINELHNMVDSKYELVRTSGYGYINGHIILPNDSMLIRYAEIDGIELPIEYFIRKVKLKPFILRWYYALVYGRCHPKNFSEIESDTDLVSRFVDGIKSGLLAGKAISFNHRNIRL